MPGCGGPAPSPAHLKRGAGAGWLSPQDAIPRPLYLSVSVLTVALLLGVWAFLAYGWFVVLMGFGIASVLAVPLGILMGTFQLVEAVIEPVTDFVRYLPVSAMVPL